MSTVMGELAPLNCVILPYCKSLACGSQGVLVKFVIMSCINRVHICFCL